MNTTSPATSFSTLQEKVRKLVEHQWFRRPIIVVIILNAITLGLDTSPSIVAQYGGALGLFDKLVLAIFLIEIPLRIFAYRSSFFRDPWSLFDLVIVIISIMPHSGVLSILRILRILRLLRLITLVPSLKIVVEGLLSALPGMGAVSALLGLFLYIGSVIVTKLFGEAAPAQFGDIGISIFSLLQVTTLDGWPDMARAAMKTAPYAWIFFVFFIILTTFTVLNLFVGVMVSAMEERVADEKALKEAKKPASEGPVTVGDIGQVLTAITSLQTQVQELKAQIEHP